MPTDFFGKGVFFQERIIFLQPIKYGLKMDHNLNPKCEAVVLSENKFKNIYKHKNIYIYIL